MHPFSPQTRNSVKKIVNCWWLRWLVVVAYQKKAFYDVELSQCGTTMGDYPSQGSAKRTIQWSVGGLQFLHETIKVFWHVLTINLKRRSEIYDPEWSASDMDCSDCIRFGFMRPLSEWLINGPRWCHSKANYQLDKQQKHNQQEQ